MMKKISLITPVGAIDVVYSIPRLIERIEMCAVNGDGVQVCIPKELPYVNEPLAVATECLTKFVPLKEILNYKRAPEVLVPFMAERFKLLAAKKPVEFYVKDLNMEVIQELSMKHMDNMGSEQSVMCIFKLSPYHKFVVIADNYAFRQYVSDNGRGELVELHPTKWVMGRYECDDVLQKEMAKNMRYGNLC